MVSARVSGPVARQRFPGFDALRIAAACTVVFSHSFLIAEGTEANEPSQRLTGEILGIYAVFVFLMLSGFLVAASAKHSSSAWSFAAKRIRRVYPAFFVSCVAIVAVVCSVFATAGPADFLTDRRTWATTFDVVTFRDDDLFFWGVSFYEPGPAGLAHLDHVASGVLWTIGAEVACYVFLAAMMFLRSTGTRAVLVGTLLCLALNLFPALRVNEQLEALAFLAPSFVVGLAAHSFLAHRPIPAWVAATSACLLVIAACALPGWQTAEIALFPLLFAAPLLWLGRLDGPVLRGLRRLGDPSYGIYLWAWPIQQVARAVVGDGWSGYALAALSLPFAVAAGYASWHAIERPALSARFAPPAWLAVSPSRQGRDS